MRNKKKITVRDELEIRRREWRREIRRREVRANRIDLENRYGAVRSFR